MSEDRFSEGPYKLGDKLPMSDVSFTILETDIKTAIANAAHAEGRKAAENDFPELLEMANSMEGMLKGIFAVYVTSHAPSVEVKFNAWKKARGIE